MLELRGVSVLYTRDARPALAGVTLDVAAGECVALVGPSGGGKTTLLRSINGSVPLAGGSIRVDGVDVSTLRGPTLRRLRTRLAMVAQQHDLVDRLRVYQNVMAGALGRWSTWHALRFLIAPRRHELEEAHAALSSVGVPEKLRSLTSDLSGGQQQRVAIARALVQRPSAILADEPIASLDPLLGEQILRLLCRLARERNIALLCSLHQPELARRYFDRVVTIADGMLAVDGAALRAGGAGPAHVR
ncbi:MAG: ATP-binding cassette domain-containing protein [Candidatus Eremiobacteraeota bacterium]|nr:ATP-binding cassette domain-containing protein [Candidatus Eremiobacteraeota bacterium]MBC5802548.1 ATP-binding cassette domain-containing protein [Candidatus Eremiobacteraeota bacterium]MBC5821909.1 ATP-binding cassette domain-containing protein [Candidatus Eremiobacteraeota bacterium]